MKTLPTALATHYSAGTTTLADLLLITRTDAQVFAFTSAAEDITIDGQLYTSAQGLNISSIEVTAGLAVDNLELTTLDDNTVFTTLEVLSGRWRNADFVISRYNWQTPADGVEVRMVGTIGEVQLHQGYVTAELRGLQQYLQQPIGSVSSKTCRARLGDALCTKDLTSFTHTGTVSSAASQQVFTGDFGGGTAGDPNWSNVVFATHLDGTNGSTSITDLKGHALTITGSAISTAQSKFGGASLYYDGVTAGSIVAATSSDFAFSGDFTIALWAKAATDCPSCYMLSNATSFAANTWILEPTHGTNPGKWCFFMHYIASTGNPLISTSNSLTDTWTHIEISKSGSTYRMFINGVIEATYTNAAAITANTTEQLFINGSAAKYKGYIDDIVITKNVAVHTTNFTPPAASFEDAPAGDSYWNEVVLALHMDGTNGSTTFTDTSTSTKTVTAAGNAQISTAQSKFGGASGLFDGTGDYLSIPTSADFAFGSGAFTIEGYFYFSSVAGEKGLISSFTANEGWNIRYSASNGGIRSVFVVSAGVFDATNIAWVPVVNTWYHLAFVRQGNSYYVFVNGTQIGTTFTFVNAITIPNSNVACTVGTSQTVPSSDFNGHIDDLRITKAARYVANFTPPAATFSDSLPAADGTPADDYFAEGILTWTSGPSDGLTVKVKAFTSSVFTLSLPMLSTISADESFSVIAGCQKRLEDCSTKFDNVLNFQGEPHLPGIDEVTK